MTSSFALSLVGAASESNLNAYRTAVSALASADLSTTIVWLRPTWAVAPVQTPIRATLLPARILRRLESLLAENDSPLARRAEYAICDRLGLMRAELELDGPSAEAESDSWQPRTYLAHTALGQPIARVRGGRSSSEIPAIRISFSHDGDAHATLTATGPGLKGVGIDIVQLGRLRGRRDRPYLHRFVRKFMSEAELAGFMDAGSADSDSELAVRAAAHFSLMEAASKALGTGLKIGAGMGKPASLPKQSIGVELGEFGDLRIRFLLGAEAIARMERLRAGKLEGYWGFCEEYLVSAAYLR